MRLSAALLVVAGALLFAVPAEAADESQGAKTDSWRQELRFFVTQLRAHHRSPFHLVTEKDFDAAVSALGTRVSRIDGMSIEDVMRRVQRVIPQGENQWYVLNQSAQKMVRAEVLASLGAISNVSHGVFTFDDGAAGEFTLDISRWA